MTLALGARLGPYEIVSPIGAGGMGEVYRARDTRLDRSVAVKVLPARLSSNPDLRARFEREARAVSSLNHPHICTLYDVGHQDGVDYIVMELLEGETLADRLKRGPLPVEQVLRFGIEIAEALAAAHKAGIVHRDIKPGNVLLTKAGAKLLDFGLARVGAGGGGAAESSAVQTEAAVKPLTSAGTVLGTFQYMSPEQVEGREADSRTDLWALGALLYEMATGRMAFEGKSQASLIAAILKEEPRPLPDVQPAAPATLDRLVRACLAKDPDERMQTARDVARELRWIREAAEGPAGVASLDPGSGKRGARVSWVLAALALGVLAGLWVGRHWPFRAAATEAGAPSTVTRTVIELPPSTPLGMEAAVNGINSTLLALSPDGRQLVYVAQSSGVTRLYRRALDRFDEAQPIPGTEGAIHAFFSPDGRFVGFLTDDRVKRVSIDGGDLRTLCDAPEPTQGSWTRDGTIYVATDQGAVLRRIAASGGRLEKIEAEALRGQSVTFGDALPDGRTVLMTQRRASLSADYNAILAFDVETRKPKVLVESGYDPRFVPPGYLLFTRGGNVMAVGFDSKRLEVQGEPVPVLRDVATDSSLLHAQIAISETGSVAYVPGGDRAIGRLARVDRLGHVELLPAGPDRYGQLDLSPDGTRLAVHVAGVNDYLWIWDLRRSEGRRLSGSSSPAGWPVWSPSGDSVAFSSWRPDSAESGIETQRVDGGEPPRAVLRTRSAFGFLVTGSWALTQLSVSDGWGEPLRTGLVAAGGQATVQWDETPCYFGALSRDGRWRACSSGGQVHLQSLTESHLVRQISTDGGTEPRWCGDCNELFFRRGSRWLATSVSFEPELRWDPPRVVLETSFLDTDGFSYDVSPDGKYLYVVKPAAPDELHKLHFVTGWFEELRRLVASTKPGE